MLFAFTKCLYEFTLNLWMFIVCILQWSAQVAASEQIKRRSTVDRQVFLTGYISISRLRLCLQKARSSLRIRFSSVFKDAKEAVKHFAFTALFSTALIGCKEKYCELFLIAKTKECEQGSCWNHKLQPPW